jgi:hypothetical protein
MKLPFETQLVCVGFIVFGSPSVAPAFRAEFFVAPVLSRQEKCALCFWVLLL